MYTNQSVGVTNQSVGVSIGLSIAVLMILAIYLGLLWIYVTAVFRAVKINKKIRLLLVNLLAAETCKGMVYTVFHWARPVMICKLSFSFFNVAPTQALLASTMLVMSVYFNLKHGESKLMWSMVTPPVAVSWIVATVVTATIFAVDELKTNGFCTATPDTTQYYGYMTTLVVIALILMSIQLVYSILAILHIKQNPSQEDIEEKKAVAKSLGYFVVVGSILSFTMSMTTQMIRAGSKKTTTAVDYLLLLEINWFAICMPILTIGIYKPVRDNVTAMLKDLCCLKCQADN